MAWLHVIHPIMAHFRRRRLAELLKLYPNLADYSVLDVGGRPFIWELLKEHYQVVPKRLILLNTPDDGFARRAADYSVEIADGRELPYADKSFDLVFSNSVIEHVGTHAQMAQFANECDRVGKQLYVQTPNRWFPLEAHFGAAFIHWLPRSWYKKLSFLSVRYLMALNNPNEKYYFDQEFETTDLLSKKRLQSLFPNKEIMAEKAIGFTKSFIVTNAATASSAESESYAAVSSTSST